MSRIFGFRTSRAGGRDRAAAQRQGAAMGTDAAARPTVLEHDAAHLGWTGRGAPRVGRDSGALVVLDGHIFNRRQLGASGADAELFLSLYRTKGFEGAMQAVNGDLAVALYDVATDRLWLGRDRPGSKPMYWAPVPHGLAFASQPRGLLCLADVPARVRSEYVALVAGSHYRTFDNRREASPYEAIAQLPAGHVLESGPNGTSVRAYWDLTEAPEIAGSIDQVAADYRDLLGDAVSIRTSTWAAPAFTLSGGMDSSSVLASAVRSTGAKQEAYSTVYSDPTYDETQEIRSMLASSVEAWHPVVVDAPDVFDTVARMIGVHDEPVATATWLSHWVLAEKVAADGVDVILGGLGGDELNAGEYEYFVFHFADLLAQGRDAEFEHEVERWALHHDHPVWRKDRAVMVGELDRRIDPSDAGRNRPDRHRLARYEAAVRPEYFDLGAFEPVMDHPFTSHLKNRAYQDLFRETTPCCLRAEDRHSAAFGIEHADPFLDHRLMELLFRVPGDMKFQDGVTKIVLREAMRGVLPEETRTRVKKTGWNAPAHVWFSGEAASSLRDLIESPTFADRGIYDVAVVRRLFDEHQEIVSGDVARENHMMFFWQLVNLELWLRWLQEPSGL